MDLTAVLVDQLVKNSGQDCFIVDAGDGKGYLSSRLALQYGHRVLGIDANAANTENALNRNRKLQVGRAYKIKLALFHYVCRLRSKVWVYVGESIG